MFVVYKFHCNFFSIINLKLTIFDGISESNLQHTEFKPAQIFQQRIPTQSIQSKNNNKLIKIKTKKN